MKINYFRIFKEGGPKGTHVLIKYQVLFVGVLSVEVEAEMIVENSLL